MKQMKLKNLALASAFVVGNLLVLNATATTYYSTSGTLTSDTNVGLTYDASYTYYTLTLS